jgi:hypothetical protein
MKRGLFLVASLSLCLIACSKDAPQNGNAITARANEIEAAAEAQVSEAENALNANKEAE